MGEGIDRGRAKELGQMMFRVVGRRSVAQWLVMHSWVAYAQLPRCRRCGGRDGQLCACNSTVFRSVSIQALAQARK